MYFSISSSAMDISPLFEDGVPTANGDDPRAVFGDTPITEDSFLNMLADDDNMEEFSMSLLENNHDILDFMAPIMGTPFSPIPCNDFEVPDSYHGGDCSNQGPANVTTQLTDDESPLRQLLLAKTTKLHSNQVYKTSTEPAREEWPVRVPRGRKSSQGRQPARSVSSRSRRSTSDKKVAIHHVEVVTKDKCFSKALKFPPCSICGGKASGLHYGVNSCEACKGFFRRYIIRNEEYKCAKGNNCTIVNKNRENCSGCRLKKCLDLGMSKENSKLGRYSLSRRTETIKKVNYLEGKERIQRQRSGSSSPEVNMEHFRFDHTYSGMLSGKQSPLLVDILSEEASPDSLIDDLVIAMDKILPYGPSMTTREQMNDAMEKHHLRYLSKIEMYGEMKAVPKNEHYKLLKDYGIDIDGRIKVFREYILKIKRISERYYNFAQQIPGFKNLDTRDKSQLLNSSRCDFFVALMHEGYVEETSVILARNGVPYHVDELADKFFSRDLFTALMKGYACIQKLDVNKQEKALLVALTLVFTDRCKLENREHVDKIQYLISELLRYQLERTEGPQGAAKRFAKFVNCLIYLRDVADIYWREYGQLCKDEVIVEQVPMATEFKLADEW